MMFLLPLLAAAVSARVMDKLPGVPPGWKEIKPALSNEPISLRIALRQPRAAELEQAVLDMSTPGHPNYGKHLSRLELRAYTAPSEAATEKVSTWLQKYKIEPSVDNDWVLFTTTVGAANKLLNTQFAWYEYVEGGGPKLRTLSYSIPDDLAEHVDLVQPTTRFGQLGAKKSTIFDMTILEDSPAEEDAALAATCTRSSVTPDCLKDLYNISYTAKPDGNLVGVASYLEQYARYSDLQLFEKNYVSAAAGQNFSVKLFNNGLNDQNSNEDSGEANLDVQYVLGISHPIPIVEFSTAGRGPLVPTPDEPSQPGSNEPYLEFLTGLANLSDAELPQTLTTSYGEEEQSVPQEYALKVCNLIMQLGARGVSVIFSSGDSGPGNNCVRVSDNAPFFNPTFPAGCPFVTSVGGTLGVNPEDAASFSSGGFSIYHAQPDYQKTAVPGYLTRIGSTYSSFFNASGRGIPDVSAQSNGFRVYDKGRVISLAGTSASSPVFAGIVALLNAARKSQGKPPLGFLNPWLYNNSAAFTDVTTGSGSGCRGAKGFPSAGAKWNATKGWDPVTGLGTPIFPSLLQAAAPGVKNE
ncbi:subtilisin-like protein [Thozetella sp. PMI_491]|nr:subtilisin-like protein [Thozetella sp. PMI_491]